MQRALGISIHTGWGACVVVGGSLREPEIVANEVIEVLAFDRAGRVRVRDRRETR
jgi:hypothetical protein